MDKPLKIKINQTLRFEYFLAVFLIVICQGCSNKKNKLMPISYAKFETFVNQTGYITDAEKYGWSIVQTNVYNFKKVDHADWKKPDGLNAPSSKELPVTQVSYNDAIAYCKWSGSRLPEYEEYWELIKSDRRKIVSDNLLPISPIQEVNVLGNVWEITKTEQGNTIRIAGGSLFCSENTCHGTVAERALFVDKETGNIHIGFGVIE